MLALISVFCTGFLVAYGLTLAVRENAGRFGLIDIPLDDRRMHAVAMPTSGGIGIAGGMLAALLCWLWMEPGGLSDAGKAGVLVGGGALFMLAVGVFDDVRGVGVKKKFLAQLLVAYLLLHAGFRFELAHLPFIEGDAYQHALYTMPLTMLWVVGIINAVNLIDGLDGLAAGVVAIGFVILGAIYGLLGHMGLVVFAVIVVAGIGGFLVHNFNPASIFMGDSGSLLLGYLLAVFSLAAPGHPNLNVALLIPVVVLGVPIMDTGLSILRRLYSGKPIFAPDKGHIHHHLSGRWSSRRSVLILYLVAFWFGTAAFLMAMLSPVWAVVVCLVTAMVALGWIYQLGYFSLLPITGTIAGSHQSPSGSAEPLSLNGKAHLDVAGKNGSAENGQHDSPMFGPEIDGSSSMQLEGN